MMFIGTTLPLNHVGLNAAATHAGIDAAALWAVIVVGTSGCGFLPDRRPSILFERHVFSARTKRRFDVSHPQTSGPAGGYGPPGAHQYERLIEAIGCDRRAALESASWGLGQIMGFNAQLAGYRDADDMVTRMLESENDQILGMVRFMRSTGIHDALQRRDWTAFARSYNGPRFADNRYHEKLATAHTTLSNQGLPDLVARAVQLLLTYHGFNPGKVDGIVGKQTRAAITAFTTRHKSPATGDHRDLHAALLEMLPRAPDNEISSSSGPADPRAIPDLRLVQSLLEYLGWSPGPVDGKPGPRTRNAIAGFEQSRGAAKTGEAGAELLVAAEATRGFGQNRVTDTRLIQRLLAIGSFDPGDIDGLVGPRTRAAIAAFAQSQSGSPTDALDAGLLNALLASAGIRTESRGRA